MDLMNTGSISLPYTKMAQLLGAELCKIFFFFLIEAKVASSGRGKV